MFKHVCFKLNYRNLANVYNIQCFHVNSCMCVTSFLSWAVLNPLLKGTRWGRVIPSLIDRGRWCSHFPEIRFVTPQLKNKWMQATIYIKSSVAINFFSARLFKWKITYYKLKEDTDNFYKQVIRLFRGSGAWTSFTSKPDILAGRQQHYVFLIKYAYLCYLHKLFIWIIYTYSL